MEKQKRLSEVKKRQIRRKIDEYAAKTMPESAKEHFRHKPYTVDNKKVESNAGDTAAGRDT